MYFLGNVGALIGSFDVRQSAFSLALSPNNQILYVGLMDGQVQKWNLSEAPPQYQSQPLQYTTEPTALTALNKDGSLALIGFNNGEIWLLEKGLKMWSQTLFNESINWVGLGPPVGNTSLSFFVAGSTKASLVILRDNFELILHQEFLDIPSELVICGEPICLLKEVMKAATIIIGCQQGQLIGAGFNKEKPEQKMEQLEDYLSIKALASTCDHDYLAILNEVCVTVKNARLETIATLELNRDHVIWKSICFAWTQERHHLIGLTSSNQLCTYKIAPNAALVLKDKIQLEEPTEDLQRSFNATDEFFLCLSEHQKRSTVRSVKGCKIRDFGSHWVHLSTANSVLILENATLTLSDSLSCHLNASLHCHGRQALNLHCDSTNLITNSQFECKVWTLPATAQNMDEGVSPLVSVAFLGPDSILSLNQDGKLRLNGKSLERKQPPKEGLFTSMSVCCYKKSWIICVTSMHEISLWLLEEGYSYVVPLAFLCLDSSPNGGKPLCSSVHRSSRKDDATEEKVTLLIGQDDGFYRKVVGDIIGKKAFSPFLPCFTMQGVPKSFENYPNMNEGIAQIHIRRQKFITIWPCLLEIYGRQSLL